jgi:predicted deacylase
MISESNVEVGVRGGLNVMKWLEMIPGEREEQRGITIIEEQLEYYGILRANYGGILHPEVKAGEKIQKGAIIARIFNLYGEVVEAVKMPIDGYLVHFGVFGKWSVGISTGQTITEILQVRK